MNSQLQKQILIGGLAGILITVLTWVFLGGKRDELVALNAQIETLQKEVDKGYQLKANYEKLKIEVAQQEKLIEELIKLMPTETDKGEMPYRIKKLADLAGIEQVSFTVEGAIKKEYYTEYPFTFGFKAGYHSFGQFTSQVSGNEKIINVSEIQMKREPGKPLWPASVTCRVSAFVYNPAPPKPPAPPPGSAAAPAGKKADAGD
ncbi:MAG: type 4a pilus biogenesis protein PilO [Holophaga sp.]|nr:type 4a pilus biogenesis protein PilO [Holophaga sp.]